MQKLIRTVTVAYLLGAIALPLIGAEAAKEDAHNRCDSNQESVSVSVALIHNHDRKQEEKGERSAFDYQATVRNRQLFTWYAQQGDNAGLQRLLDAGVDVNSRDNGGLTALHRAAIWGNEETVGLLLERRADPTITFNGDRHMAWQGEKISGSDRSHLTKLLECWKVTPLHCVAARGHTRAVALLLNAKADVNARDTAGDTPLHVVDRDVTGECTRLLLAAKADVSACNENGNTPLHAIRGDDKGACTRLLLAAKADVSACNENGNTPLHAIRGDDKGACTRLLLEAKAHIDCKNKQGRTPLFVSQSVGHAQALVEAGAPITRDMLDMDHVYYHYRPSALSEFMSHMYVVQDKPARNDKRCPCAIL